MARILILTSSVEGQTDKIADRIATTLRDAHEVTVASFGEHPVVAGYDAVLVGASVHIGHYPQPLERFLDANLDILREATSGFFSVSLSAVHDDAEHSREVAETVGTFLDELGWRPDAVVAFGGALHYRAYTPLERFLARRIAAQNGLPTDTSRDWEFTDWDEVEHFAGVFGEIAEARRSAR